MSKEVREGIKEQGKLSREGLEELRGAIRDRHRK